MFSKPTHFKIKEHRVIHAGDCLVTHLVQVLEANPESLSQFQIVLPTQRLHLYIARELCRRFGGNTLLPKMWTWDQWIREIIYDFQSNDVVMVSSQCEWIMEQILSEPLQFKHVNSRHAHELLNLHSEIQKSSSPQRCKQALLDYLSRDWRRSEDVFEAISTRVTEVFQALDLFDQKLTQFSWTTREKTRSDAVRLWLAGETESKWQYLPSGPIIVAGLTSLPEVEHLFLKELSNHPQCSVWLDQLPPNTVESPLSSLFKSTGIKMEHAASGTWAKGVQNIFTSGDVTHEVLHGLSRVQAFINQGIPAHEIAIIVPDEEAYGPAFDVYQTCLTCTVNSPLAAPWSTSSIARWLKLAIDVGQSFEATSIGQFALHPFTKLLFSAPDQLIELNIQRGLKNFPDSSPHPDAMLQFLNSSRSLHSSTSPTVHYLVELLEWCYQSSFQTVDAVQTELLRISDLFKNSQKNATPKEQSSWQIFESSIDAVLKLLPMRPYHPKHWRLLLKDIYRTASQEPIRNTGEPLSGLQIIGLTEARYLPLSAALIVGCVEGSFPHALPKDSLMDNSMRMAMGLSGWSDLEALEDTTFHLLTSRLPYVELSYPEFDAGQTKIRSRWIEQLSVRTPVHSAAQGAQTPLLPAVSAISLRPAKSGHLNEQSQGYAPDWKDLLQTASASRLRDLIWCPYRYLLNARSVERIECPEDRASIKVGRLLHKILEQFFNDVHGLPIPKDLMLTQCPEDPLVFAFWAHKRLDELSRHMVPLSLSRTSQFQQMAGRGWKLVVQFWTKLFQAGFHPKHVSCEVTFGKPSNSDESFAIHVGQTQVTYHGTIDAVHRFGTKTLVVDYKTSYAPTASQIAQGLEPQLVLYALASHTSSDSHEQLPQTIAAAYFNLSDGSESMVASTKEMKQFLVDQLMISKQAKPADFEDSLNALKARWLQRQESIESTQQFLADPSDCNFCNFSGICRKDDPRYRDQIESQKVAKP